MTITGSVSQGGQGGRAEGLNPADSALLKIANDPAGFAAKLEELTRKRLELEAVAGVVSTLRQAEAIRDEAEADRELAAEELQRASREHNLLVEASGRAALKVEAKAQQHLDRAKSMEDEARGTLAEAEALKRSATSAKAAATVARQAADDERAAASEERAELKADRLRLKAALGDI